MEIEHGGIMNRVLLAVAFILILTTSTYAATTGTLLLQGSVPQKISLSVTPQAIASTLDLAVSQNDLVVASVNEKSNSKTGYKVTIASDNLSKLKRVDGSEVMAYTMKYNGSAVALSAASGTTITNSAASTVNLNKSVSISYTGVASESMIEGSYSDTVTFTIAAN
jgi:hypothetical protein